MTPPMIGVDLIHAERTRQLEVEGFTPAHDAHHHCGELSSAATCYLSVAASCSLLAATAEIAARIAAHDAAAAPAAAVKVAGPPPGTRRTTFDLPEQDHRDLRVACLEEGVAAAHVVRVLVRRFLDDLAFRAEIVDDAAANGRVA